MSELRQRPTATAARSEKTETPQRRRPSDNDEDHGISLLDVIRVIVTLIVASCGLSYYMTSTESMLWGYRPWFTRWPVVKQWVVRTSPHTLIPHNLPTEEAIKVKNEKTNISLNKAWPGKPHTSSIIPLQRHRYHPPPLPRRKRDHLRRL
jgi:hypothetical protein